MFWLLLLILPYSAIILFAWLNLRKNVEECPSGSIADKDLPKVSLIIAAKNEENNLPYLISDLRKLDYPAEKLEILIVDDHSVDRTAKIIESSGAITYLASSGKGKKQAIATALNQSTGELILSSDADCRIPPGWVRIFAEKYIREDADFIIGQVNTFTGKGLINQFSDLEFYSLQAVTGGLALGGHPLMCNGASLGFRKSSVPGYLDAVRPDIPSGDDMFLLHYMKKNKNKICWLNHSEGRVETKMPDKPGLFLKQRSRWAGKGIFYKDPDTILLALSTLLGNLSLLAAIILLLINTSYLALAAGIYLLKCIPEILLISEYPENPGKIKKLLAFLPLSLIYPFYVLIITLLSPFLSGKW